MVNDAPFDPINRWSPFAVKASSPLANDGGVAVVIDLLI
jgi:hypothetical protein